MPSVYHLLDPIAQKPHRGEILRSKWTIMTVEPGPQSNPGNLHELVIVCRLSFARCIILPEQLTTAFGEPGS